MNWMSRSGSCRMRIASATENSGARLPSELVTTGPSARFDTNDSSVTAAGNPKPTAAKIGTARQTMVSPYSRNGDSRRKTSVKRRNAQRRARQRVDGAEPELGENHAGAEECRRREGEQDGGHGTVVAHAPVCLPIPAPAFSNSARSSHAVIRAARASLGSPRFAPMHEA